MPVANPPSYAYAPAETWFWNGTPLSRPYWNIATFGGSRMGVPVNRGGDYEVPYRAGQLWRAKYPDSRTITLTMWTDSQMSASQAYPAGDPRLAFNDNFQALRQLFYTRGPAGSVQGQLQRNWFLTGSGSPALVQSTAMAEIAGSMDPTMNGRTSAAFSVDILLNDPYFYAPVRGQTITSPSGNITALGEGIVGEGYPSAVNAFTVTVSQASTVTNTTAGVSFTHSGAGVASWPVVVDVLRYTATDHVGNNVVGGLSHVGSRMWMCLLPGVNAITVTAGTAIFTFCDTYV